MNLGLSLGLGNRAAGAPTSLYTTANFTLFGPVDHREIIDGDSFRYARTAAGAGRLDITGVPSGTYRVTATVSAWDGTPLPGLTTTFTVNDLFTQRFTTGTLGAVDTGVISITSGTLAFQQNNPDQGARVDNLFITRIS
jgi:hypothetical protein